MDKGGGGGWMVDKTHHNVRRSIVFWVFLSISDEEEEIEYLV